MSEFIGTKFRPTGRTVRTVNDRNEFVYKEEFACTRSYLKYCKEKRVEAARLEVARVKAKMENEFKTLGQVDDYTIMEFQAAVRDYTNELNAQSKPSKVKRTSDAPCKVSKYVEPEKKYKVNFDIEKYIRSI